MPGMRDEQRTLGRRPGVPLCFLPLLASLRLTQAPNVAKPWATMWRQGVFLLAPPERKRDSTPTWQVEDEGGRAATEDGESDVSGLAPVAFERRLFGFGGRAVQVASLFWGRHNGWRVRGGKRRCLDSLQDMQPKNWLWALCVLQQDVESCRSGVSNAACFNWRPRRGRVLFGVFCVASFLCVSWSLHPGCKPVRFEGKQALLCELAEWPTLWQKRRVLQAAGFERRALRHVLCTNLSPCLSLCV